MSPISHFPCHLDFGLWTFLLTFPLTLTPTQSLSNATLDQQCTVTRPGIAPLASSLLVELLVSILQHPARARAPTGITAPQSTTTTPTAPSNPTNPSHPSLPAPLPHPLGTIPHTIRGYLSSFSNLLVQGTPYDCCSACSSTVLAHYATDPWAFVRRALNEKGWVEEMSGLAEVQRKADEAEADVDWDEEDEGGLEDEGEII